MSTICKFALKDGTESGSAEIPFTVEGNDGNRLAVSGIALVKRYRQVPSGPRQMPTELPVSYAPLLSQGLELTPAADTSFARSDPFAYYLEVFEPLAPQSPAPAVQVRLRIVDAESGEVKKDLPPFSAAPYMKEGRPGHSDSGTLNIDRLSKGLYHLEVQATDSAGSSTPWRATKFTVQ